MTSNGIEINTIIQAVTSALQNDNVTPNTNVQSKRGGGGGGRGGGGGGGGCGEVDAVATTNRFRALLSSQNTASAVE